MRARAFSSVALAVALIALPAGGAVAQMGGGRMGGGQMGGGMEWGNMSGMMTGFGADADRAKQNLQGIGPGREVPFAGDDATHRRQSADPGGQTRARSVSPQGSMAPSTGRPGGEGATP